MKKFAKVIALALGSMLALATFAACGDKGSEGGNGNGNNNNNNNNTTNPPAAATSLGSIARICYDNLGEGYVNAADTKIAVEGATDIKAYDYENTKISDYKQVATYENGVFTAVSAGQITYKAGGKQGRIEVVPAYATNPRNQYKGSNTDTDLNSGQKYLGYTHDPSFIEVTENGLSTYYLFSTGWQIGNDVHRSNDNMLTWEYVGKTTQKADYSNEKVFPEDLINWMYAKDNEKDISWWAPDIVEAKGGGYWLYTCPTMSSSVQASTMHSGSSVSPSTNYSQACIIQYYIKNLADIGTAGAVEYKGVLMQSCIPQNGDGAIDINGIDPQIIYSPDGKMYMAYGSFGTGNWMIELNPETGLRLDGDNEFHNWEWVRKQRNKVVTGDETKLGTRDLTQSDVYAKFTSTGEYEHPYYGKMISLGAMEGPVIARHDNVKVADETATYNANGEPEGVQGKTYYYTMHSYNGLADNYQMWGGRSESVWGTYRSTGGGIVYNVNVNSGANSGNKYMGAFKWRAASKAANSKEFDIVLPGHNDLYTAKSGTNVAAYITRTFAYGGERFVVQLHQYYLNSKGDICINPNRYGGEIDRAVSEEELFALTDGGKFEMVALTNAADWSKGSREIYNESFEVVLDKTSHKIKRGNSEIGEWQIYGKGYIKFTFSSALKGTGSYNTNETVYYGVIRPTWLRNSEKSGFTITCMGNTAGSKQSMAMFMNSHTAISL